jgi:hypothetical protein
MPSDTIGSVLQPKQQKHVGQSILSTSASRKIRVDANAAPSAAEVIKANENQALWEWVEIPDNDIFGEPHTGVSVNFEQFLPGKHYVSPEMAHEIKRLLDNRMRGDIRVLQPRQDAVMARIMAKSQLGAPVNPELKGLNDA